MPVTETVHDSGRLAGVAELVVESPPVNAYSIGDLAQLTELLRSYERREEVRAVVLRAQGKGFCGGGDVKEVQSLPGFDGILGQARGSQDTSVAIAECAVPVIGCIHGYCVGLGVLLAGTCDVLIGSRGTRFVLAEADNGATTGAVQALGLLPERRLRSAMFTCEPFDIAELHSYGSVYHVEATVEAALARTYEVAATIAAKAPRVIRALKLTLNNTAGRDLRRLYRQELSYTFELNMLGDSSKARQTFLDGTRDSYMSDTSASSS
ncbi:MULTISPECIES: enoyl-CoA hydratase-related protein [Mycobacterium]|uniref:Enoyl-CoA hydratase n=1 Tax=Mycobacterium palustre TaxID=153971 RepID=A0A1X1ZAV9_9MYCO|nr:MULTISPECIES: enoyl-CoA hydratase-related protein [Mycobacterium]AFJ34659.1 enoyl-CoA hydratase/isomerase [Mycobacterium sp. MOTT36Y]ORW20472.1 enoyl-CoA hydratase [Mycobacterium palustre]